MEDISANIKKVLIVFAILFVALISYLSYFVIVQGPAVARKPMNQRLWAKRNEVLRGTIYDRNLKALTRSEKISRVSQKREYLGGELFAHVLGYVDPRFGLTGLEYNYDSDLTIDKGNGILKALKGEKDEGELEGNGVRITIDYDTQKAAFDLLGNQRGAVVALDPKTGEVLAMVSKPSFDPNKLSDIWDSLQKDKNRPLINRAVSGLYPPGSTFKTITAVSALENIGGIMNKTLVDKGKLVFNSKYSLSNYGGEAMGTLDFREAYVKSSNVFFGTLGLELGNDKLYKTAEKFLFNKNIPSDGIIIDNSRFPKLKDYEKGNMAQSAIGQGAVLATPMQMALVAGTIANGGVMMEPMLVSEVLSSRGETLRTIEPREIAQVTSKKNADIVREFMRGVVTSGTGGNARIPGINVAGKTGTADHDDIPNVKEAPHSWFIGFAPYESPQIAIAVIVEEGGTGGSNAAKIAAGVIKAYLKK